jgi:hypothetical protein
MLAVAGWAIVVGVLVIWFLAWLGQAVLIEKRLGRLQEAEDEHE